MKKPSRIQTVALAAVLSVAVGLPFVLAQTSSDGAQKQGRRHMRAGGQHRGDRMGGRIFGQLDLTDAQKAQIKQIRQAHQESLRPLRQEIRTKRMEIRQANQGGTFDEALVSQKLAEIAPLEAKLMGEQFRLHQQMLSVLTPEQKTKMEQLREQFKSRSGERRARRGQKST